MQLTILLALLTVSLSGGHENCRPPSEAQWTCNGQGFKVVPQIGFTVEVLDLSENNLTELTDDSFQPYNELIELHLSHNTLNKINVGAFRNLTALTYVDLSSNNLTYIQPCTFYFNLNLEKLLLQHNPLHQLDLKSTSLQILDLRFVGLSDLSVTNFADLSSLNYLYLSHNTSHQPVIRNMTTLFTLQLINVHDHRPCDLTVTWQSDADNDAVECWKYTSNVHRKIDGCTEDRITTTTDFTVGSLSHSEDENESESPPSEIVTVLFTKERRRTNVTDTSMTQSTTREPEHELSDWWLENRFSLKDYLIIMSILLICVIIGLFIVHHLVVPYGHDSLTGIIYKIIK